MAMTKASLRALAASVSAPITRVAEGTAYGIDAKADKAKRIEARQMRSYSDTPILAAIDHLGRGWYKNAEGEVIGHD